MTKRDLEYIGCLDKAAPRGFAAAAVVLAICLGFGPLSAGFLAAAAGVALLWFALAALTWRSGSDFLGAGALLVPIAGLLTLKSYFFDGLPGDELCLVDGQYLGMVLAGYFGLYLLLRRPLRCWLKCSEAADKGRGGMSGTVARR